MLFSKILSAGRRRSPARQRRLAMVALMTVVILATLDTTISNTALPRIARDLGASEASVIWVANAYQIAMIGGLLPLASFAESIGYRRVYIGGVALFGAASLLCGASDALEWLVLGRALQGAGAAAIMGVNTAFIRLLYPPDELGKGLSMNAFVVAIGFTLGPPLASALLSVATWHWLYLINVPVALAAWALSLEYLPDASAAHRFDWAAAVLCAGTLALLTFAFCALENGAGSGARVAALVVGAICLAGLLRVQSGHPAPMLALDLLKRPTIALSSATSICAYATQALAFVGLPFFLQSHLGLSLVSMGLFLTTWPAVVAVMALVVSPLSDRCPPGALCSVGLVLLGLGMALLATLDPSDGPASIIARLAVCGAGFGMFQAPNLKAIMGGAPTSRSGGASALVGLSRLLGQTTGAAGVAQCFHAWGDAGAHAALWIGAATATTGALVSVLRLRTNLNNQPSDSGVPSLGH